MEQPQPAWEVESFASVEISHPGEQLPRFTYKMSVRMYDNEPREIILWRRPEEGEIVLNRESSEWELVIEIIEKQMALRQMIQCWPLDRSDRTRLCKSA